MIKILEYKDVMKETENHTKYLLLGNGFSMAYASKMFSFDSLLKSAIGKKIIKEDSCIDKIFSAFGTKNFEEVIKLIENSATVLKIYNATSEEEYKKMRADSETLKEHLVDVIVQNHPDKITSIDEEKFLCSANFIKEFTKVYTLNYDLLLYWTYIKLHKFIETKRIEKSVLGYNDGFLIDCDSDDVIFSGSPKQNIFHLHGGLHIFDSGNKIIKKTFFPQIKNPQQQPPKEQPLKKQILKSIKQDIYPIFVSEGTSEQKMTNIMHNAYLNHCYKSLTNIGKINSSLIIFGTLLKKDNHIKKAILKNKVKTIYIGVLDQSEISELNGFVEEAKNKEVKFYDYNTAKVWG